MSAFTELELVMFALVRAKLASKAELEDYYDLDEALKLFALYQMDNDIQRLGAEEARKSMKNRG